MMLQDSPCRIGEFTGCGKDAMAYFLMPLHDLPLIGNPPIGLVEDGLINTDLPDIMHQTGNLHLVSIL